MLSFKLRPLQGKVDVLKEYADYQWERDADFYVIFEHLGTNTEETQWINYRLSEGKGILVWGNHNGNYNEATLGYHEDGKSDFSWISYKNRGWSVPANVSYMESHDEERLMFKNLQFGNANDTYDIKNLATALDRIEMASTFYFTIPGPKMIWQFGELGYDISLNQNGRTGNKPILWNYFEEQNRADVYNTYSKLIQLKLKYDIFETSDFTLDVANSNGLKKVQLTDTSSSEIQYVTIIGNFGVITQNIDPTFQVLGTWYNLLDGTETLNIINTTNTITLAPGEFKVFGNKPAVLSIDNNAIKDLSVTSYPNPTKDSFRINATVNHLIIFDSTGKTVKEFKGNFNPDTSFSIQNLEKGIYFIKMDSKNSAIKLVKN